MQTKPLFEVNEVDRQFYERRLRDFLPRRIIDIHTRIFQNRDYGPEGAFGGDSRILRGAGWR